MKKLLFLSTFLLSAANIAFAVPYYETVSIANGTLGSLSTVKWLAPNSTKYKVQVYVPTTGTATNALYRVYPKGDIATNTTCSSTDAVHPCFEIAVNQVANQGKWVQLMVGGKASTQWAFTKNIGFVSVNTDSSTSEAISVSVIRFEKATSATGYSKISNSGVFLADSALLGISPTNWGCTRDNATGLIWEIKTDDGDLRDKDNTYSWYSLDLITNGSYAGAANGGLCTGNIPCDTDAYVLAVNAKKLCGHNDWRLPNVTELSTLLNRVQIPTINLSYFPNTVSKKFWSSSTYTSNSYAWVVDLASGSSNYSMKSYTSNAIRLVRGGQ